MAVPKPPGEKPTGPKSIQDFMVGIKEISEKQSLQANKREQEEIRRDAILVEQQRLENLHGLLNMARRAYPRSISIKNFDRVTKDGIEYPAIRIKPREPYDGAAKKQIPGLDEITVVFTYETTNIPEMKRAIDILKKSGEMEVGIAWDLKLDNDYTRVTSASVDGIYIRRGAHKHESYSWTNTRGQDWSKIPDRDRHIELLHPPYWEDCDISYYKTLYSKDGNFRDRTEIDFRKRPETGFEAGA